MYICLFVWGFSSKFCMFPCSQHIIYKVICINEFESYLNRFQNVKAVFIGLWMLSIDSKSYARALSTVFALHAKKII